MGEKEFKCPKCGSEEIKDIKSNLYAYCAGCRRRIDRKQIKRNSKANQPQPTGDIEEALEVIENTIWPTYKPYIDLIKTELTRLQGENEVLIQGNNDVKEELLEEQEEKEELQSQLDEIAALLEDDETVNGEVEYKIQAILNKESK